MSRADLQAQTRAALIASARQLFVDRGYVRTTIDEIATGAGYTRGAFYANFKDKGDLFLAILEQERDRSFSQLAAELEQLADDAILSRLGDWLQETFFEDPLRRARAEFALAVEDNPDHKARLANNVDAMRQLNATMIGRYCERSDITLTVDNRTFATMVSAVVAGFADHHRLDDSTVTADLVAHTLAALWAGVQRAD